MSRFRAFRGGNKLAASVCAAVIAYSFSCAAIAQCTARPQVANLRYTLKDMHGKDVDLADHAGNVILLDFWATWCAPCRIEIPGFIEMVENYGPLGFSVLGISIDDPPEALQAYAQELGMNYPVLIGDGRDDVKDEYGPIIGFPTSVIIDRNGTVCHRHIGYTPKERFIEDIEALLPAGRSGDQAEDQAAAR